MPRLSDSTIGSRIWAQAAWIGSRLTLTAITPVIWPSLSRIGAAMNRPGTLVVRPTP